MARGILWFSSLTFLGFGAAFLVAPATMAALVDLDPSTTTALTDVRAVYGGLEVGVGLLLAYAALRRERLREGLLASLVLYVALGGGRLVGIVLDGEPSAVTWRVLGAELVTALACGVALVVSRRRDVEPPGA